MAVKFFWCVFYFTDKKSFNQDPWLDSIFVLGELPNFLFRFSHFPSTLLFFLFLTVKISLLLLWLFLRHSVLCWIFFFYGKMILCCIVLCCVSTTCILSSKKIMFHCIIVILLPQPYTWQTILISYMVRCSWHM